MNGRARPKYEHNNNIPLEIDSVVEAKSKIDPRIGPIQESNQTQKPFLLELN